MTTELPTRSSCASDSAASTSGSPSSSASSAAVTSSSSMSTSLRVSWYESGGMTLTPLVAHATLNMAVSDLVLLYDSLSS